MKPTDLKAIVRRLERLSPESVSTYLIDALCTTFGLELRELRTDNRHAACRARMLGAWLLRRAPTAWCYSRIGSHLSYDNAVHTTPAAWIARTEELLADDERRQAVLNDLAKIIDHIRRVAARSEVAA